MKRRVCGWVKGGWGRQRDDGKEEDKRDDDDGEEDVD